MQTTYSNINLPVIAKGLQTPAYLYDLQVLDHEIEAATTAFKGKGIRLQAFEPANRNPEILRLLAAQNVDLTVARPSAVHNALSLGFPPELIEYSGFGLTESELNSLVATKIRINLATLTEIQWACQNHPNLQFGVRVDLGESKYEKRGIPESDFIRVLNNFPINVTRLHTYLGTSQQLVTPYVEALQKLLAKARDLNTATGLKVTEINLGGGFRYDYLARTRFNWEQLARALETIRINQEVTIAIEAGRSLFANCGNLVATIIQSFLKNERLFLVIDTNLSCFGRPSRYGFAADFPPFSTDGLHSFALTQEWQPFSQETKLTECAIVGNSHYSRDWFGLIALPDLPISEYVGKRIVIQDVGAYSESMMDTWADSVNPQIICYRSFTEGSSQKINKL